MVCGIHAFDAVFHTMDWPFAGAVEDTGCPWIWVTTVALVAPITSPAKIGAPDCSVQEFSDVQAYQFDPAGALVLKNASPTLQVAGNTVPDLNGFVVVALLKSTLLVCVLRSTSVCAFAQTRKEMARRRFRYRISLLAQT